MGLSLCLSLPVLEELTSEILLRVPVRSFLRFRCVWNALVSSYPQFFAPQPPIQTCDWSLPYTASPAKSYLTLCNQCSKTHLSPKHISLLHNEGRFHVLDVRSISSRRLAIRVRSSATASSSNITYHGFGYYHVNDMYKLLLVVEVEHRPRQTTGEHLDY
ncbi:hypothetical protein JHK87_056871 [Glycine soja]|nr:hypothetical protein JHK87_056871 [Glycine soja]